VRRFKIEYQPVKILACIEGSLGEILSEYLENFNTDEYNIQDILTSY